MKIHGNSEIEAIKILREISAPELEEILVINPSSSSKSVTHHQLYTSAPTIRDRSMSTLLVQSCSKSKKQTDEPISAIDLYSGYFFKIIKKSIREETVNSDIDVCILSAKYGFVKSDEKITTYDRQMNSERAIELGPTIREDLKNYISQMGYNRIIINAGKEYRKAISGFGDDISADIYEITGDGLGLKGRSLKKFLRGDESGISRVD